MLYQVTTIPNRRTSSSSTSSSKHPCRAPSTSKHSLRNKFLKRSISPPLFPVKPYSSMPSSPSPISPPSSPRSTSSSETLSLDLRSAALAILSADDVDSALDMMASSVLVSCDDDVPRRRMDREELLQRWRARETEIEEAVVDEGQGKVWVTRRRRSGRGREIVEMLRFNGEGRLVEWAG